MRSRLTLMGHDTHCVRDGLGRPLCLQAYILRFALEIDRFTYYTDAVGYKSHRNVVCACKYHLFWRPNYRREKLVSGADERPKASVREAAPKRQEEGFELEVMPDPVHLLVDVKHLRLDGDKGALPGEAKRRLKLFTTVEIARD